MTNNGEIVNTRHGRNCEMLSIAQQSRLRYVINSFFLDTLSNLVDCDICNGELKNEAICTSYCCLHEGYILDRKHRIIHSTDCYLMEKYYDSGYCFFKKKSYKLFEMKTIDFDLICDICLDKVKRLQ